MVYIPQLRYCFAEMDRLVFIQAQLVKAAKIAKQFCEHSEGDCIPTEYEDGARRLRGGSIGSGYKVCMCSKCYNVKNT